MNFYLDNFRIIQEVVKKFDLEKQRFYDNS